MSDCRKCAEFNWCVENEDCGLFKPKPLTNADRIRKMDIDHLIEWFCRGRPCGTCPYNGVECGIRKWLNQEEKK